MLHQKFTVFDFIFYLILILLSVTILLPFIHLLSISLSPSYVATTPGLHLIPKDITLDNYVKVFTSRFIWVGYKNTIIRTVVGTIVQLFVTSIGAYALSKKYFPHRTFWTFIIVFTMFFSGGLIPTYLLIKELGLINRYAAMILPSLVSAFNLVIMRNFFSSIPDDYEESCMIDGANRFVIFFTIIVPLSMPILATVGLWLVVGHWNSWFDVLLYIQDDTKFTLQIILRRIILSGTQQLVDMTTGGVFFEETNSSPEGLKAASIYIATIPILCTYPYIQKYFVKGIMIGSLKG
ncbi:MAG: carbohydrate ABC transporter permease [Clostridiaceae bacterium]|jgi:putative aldouronate transport system permease protein|nr:carbohydrate ABC transporter permease [Clostridiaceae bacterium]